MGWYGLQCGASLCVRLLLRILQRASEVLVGDLQVMLHGHRHGIPDPGTHHVGRVIVGKLSFSG